MKFFIPKANDSRMAQNVLESIKEFVGKTMYGEITDRKIFRIEYKHKGNNYVAEVGQAHPATRETVIAILESGSTFFVCTWNRGVNNGMPILVGKDEVYSVVDFE